MCVCYCIREHEIASVDAHNHIPCVWLIESEGKESQRATQRAEVTEKERGKESPRATQRAEVTAFSKGGQEIQFFRGTADARFSTWLLPSALAFRFSMLYLVQLNNIFTVQVFITLIGPGLDSYSLFAVAQLS